MKKVVMFVLAVMLSVVFASTGFTQDKPAATPPAPEKAAVGAPEKAKEEAPAKETKKAKKVKKHKKAKKAKKEAMPADEKAAEPAAK
jgi:hypothetical protein